MEDLKRLDTLIDFEDENVYYSDTEYVTNSMLGRLDKSPQHLQIYLEGGKEDSKALSFGKAFHTMVLEPNKLDDTIAVFEGKTRRGKVWDDFSMEHSDKVIISSSEWDTLTSMYNVILKNNAATEFLSQSQKECVNIWQEGLTNLKCKGKADCVIDTGSGKILIDIKTTADASLDVFRRSCWKYGYDRQAAWYLDGFNATEFWFIVIEKTAPYRIGIYKAGDELITEGRKKNRRLVDMYHEYFVTKELNINDYYIKGEL
jgi:exodeoxyribonuclease VIII